MHHRIVIIILGSRALILHSLPLLLLYQNSIHVLVGMTIACLVSQHSAMFESPGLFVVRRPSANSRWGGVQHIYAIAAVLLERDMSDPSLLLSTYPSSLDIDAQSVLQLFTHFLTISIHLNLEEGTSLICMCSYNISKDSLLHKYSILYVSN